MHMKTLEDLPARPQRFVDRGAELASRIGGVALFALTLAAVAWLVLR